MLKKLYHAIVPPHLRPSGHIRSLVRRRTNCRVYSGPFKGIKWIPEDDNNAKFDIPKLLGIYERELSNCMERVCALNFSLIIDVGAAEGYYAVGLAARNPASKIVAF
jgi:hypothetical protein